MRGLLWLISGLAVALIAGVVAFAFLSRATPAPGPAQVSTLAPAALVEAVVAIETVGVRSLLTSESVELRQLPVDSLPDGALSTLEEAVGKITLVDLYPGEVILGQRLADPDHITGNGRTALLMEEGQVLFAVPPSDLMSNIGVLKAGDRVDLIFSFDFTGNGGSKAEKMTFSLLQNVSLSAMIGGTVPEGATSPVDPRALLLMLDPQDVLVLKQMLDMGAKIDLVLRAPDDDQEFDLDPVDEEYIVNGWSIPR